MTTNRLLLTAILSAFPLAAVAADAVLQFETKDLADGELRRGRMLIHGESLRIETEDPAAAEGEATIVFRGDRDTLYVLNDKDKSYMELNQETITAMTGTMNAMMKQMQERVAGMPPEQQKMMQQLMQGKMPAAAEEKPKDRHELKRNGEEKEIAGYPCTRWDAMKNDERVAELWLTPFKSAGVDPKSFAVLGDLADFFQGVLVKLGENPMMKAGNAEGAELLSSLKGLEGVPVMIRRIENGAVTEETRMIGISSDGVKPEMFEFAGYSKRDMMGGPGGPGGRTRP